jgi:purine-binding chemotaxis protein CheW
LSTHPSPPLASQGFSWYSGPMGTAVSEARGPLQVVIFSLEGKTLAVDILKVQEIIRMVEVTPVPKMPPFALGVINLRGKIVPIINIRDKLGLPEGQPTVKTCIILVRSGQQILGFLVDDVAEVYSLPRESIEKPQSGPAWLRSDLFSGVGKLSDRLLVILDTSRLLSATEEKQLRRASASPPPLPE